MSGDRAGSPELVETEADAVTRPSRFRTVRIIDHTVEALAAACLVVITLILFWNATSRYLFDSPIGWAEEIVTGMLLWLTMLGLVIAARRNDLIVVRVVVRRFSTSVQVWLKLAADTVSAVVFTHLAWVGWQYLLVFGSDRSAYLRLPRGFFVAALPIGALAVAIVLLLQLRSAHEAVERWTSESASEPRDGAGIDRRTGRRAGTGSGSDPGDGVQPDARASSSPAGPAARSDPAAGPAPNPVSDGAGSTARQAADPPQTSPPASSTGSAGDPE
ncbi:TRAP transporter small permease [Actinoalloteichus sp. GBA129-24]|uniref:TRAP transporter small permease n=1 Tax=Actinoalloteichus sp. GBA129-24 TaxID=1612551 RepID=UPI000950800A|nr:TRAP transporter small permease [Actinoalloteichus sp. GBA129-24]APU22191.1 TRAP-type C4-dicarboxylate transport system, small permease component [Actinoalloteichus sp. GBA129-24]